MDISENVFVNYVKKEFWSLEKIQEKKAKRKESKSLAIQDKIWVPEMVLNKFEVSFEI